MLFNPFLYLSKLLARNYANIQHKGSIRLTVLRILSLMAFWPDDMGLVKTIQTLSHFTLEKGGKVD